MPADDSGSGRISVSLVAAGPEIDIQGNGISIPAGDTTPSEVDGTDFGGVGLLGGHVDHTFWIWNLGDETLNLTMARRS